MAAQFVDHAGAFQAGVESIPQFSYCGRSVHEEFTEAE
jgi:hypothetical protein